MWKHLHVLLGIFVLVAASTTASAAMPTSPNPLQGRSTSSTSLALSWTNSVGEESYLLYRWDGKQWVFTTTVARDVTAFNVSGLAAGTRHIFIVGASNTDGVVWSGWKEFSTPAADVRIAGVPFLSQLSATCSPNYLCQYACASMLAGKSFGSQWTTTSVMQSLARHAKGSGCPKTLSNINDARNALNTLSGTSRAVSTLGSLDQVKRELQAGTPVSVSVQYGELGNYRFNRGWASGHQIVLIGYSEFSQTWTYLDPLAPSGGEVTVPSATLRNGINRFSGQSDAGLWYLAIR